MSQGSPVYTIRFNEQEKRRIDEIIRGRNALTMGEPWNFSDFIRAAINEKIAHMERSRHSRRRKAKEVVYEG